MEKQITVGAVERGEARVVVSVVLGPMAERTRAAECVATAAAHRLMAGVYDRLATSEISAPAYVDQGRLQWARRTVDGARVWFVSVPLVIEVDDEIEAAGAESVIQAARAAVKP